MAFSSKLYAHLRNGDYNKRELLNIRHHVDYRQKQERSLETVGDILYGALS
ncbi:hypothetical protein Mapa_014443 [Marchantia paleacea]|nr:hypothetical protein Mapa_014443 [Marchantia paleacea]